MHSNSLSLSPTRHMARHDTVNKVSSPWLSWQHRLCLGFSRNIGVIGVAAGDIQTVRQLLCKRFRSDSESHHTICAGLRCMRCRCLVLRRPRLIFSACEFTASGYRDWSAMNFEHRFGLNGLTTAFSRGEARLSLGRLLVSAPQAARGCMQCILCAR